MSITYVVRVPGFADTSWASITRAREIASRYARARIYNVETSVSRCLFIIRRPFCELNSLGPDKKTWNEGWNVRLVWRTADYNRAMRLASKVGGRVVVYREWS